MIPGVNVSAYKVVGPVICCVDYFAPGSPMATNVILVIWVVVIRFSMY